MKQHQKFSTSLVVPLIAQINPSPVRITSLPDWKIPLTFHSLVNKFPYKLAPKVPNSLPKKPTFCPFVFFLIVSPTTLINKSESLRDLTILILLFTFLYLKLSFL